MGPGGPHMGPGGPHMGPGGPHMGPGGPMGPGGAPMGPGGPGGPIMMSREGPIYMASNGVPFRMGPNGPEPMHMIQGPRPGMEHLRPPMGPPMSMGDMGGPGPISPGPMSGHGPGGPQPHSPMGSQPG